jgi:hypothetical protein
VDVASEGRETDGERGVATFPLTFCVLIMLNNCVMSVFVARVASACSHSCASRFWSRLVSIAVEVIGASGRGYGMSTTFGESTSEKSLDFEYQSC